MSVLGSNYVSKDLYRRQYLFCESCGSNGVTLWLPRFEEHDIVTRNIYKHFIKSRMRPLISEGWVPKQQVLSAPACVSLSPKGVTAMTQVGKVLHFSKQAPLAAYGQCDEEKAPDIFLVLKTDFDVGREINLYAILFTKPILGIGHICGCGLFFCSAAWN